MLYCCSSILRQQCYAEHVIDLLPVPRGEPVLYRFAHCTLNTQLHTLCRAGQSAVLSPKVFEVLCYLMTQRERVVSKQELCDHVWQGLAISDATLESCIRAVRMSVGDSGQAQQIIQTQRGYGYRFVAAVDTLPDASPSAAAAMASPAEIDPQASAQAQVRTAPAPPSSLRPSGGVAESLLPGMRPCGVCARANQPDATFCAACGARLRQRCSYCGQDVALPAVFCVACGQPLAPLPSPDLMTAATMAPWLPAATSMLPPQLERSRSLIDLVKTVRPFVGRLQELDWFTHVLQDVCAGKPRVVLIPGEAGIGKTRLLHEVQGLARRRGMQVYHGRCHEDVMLPYLPFVEALRTQLEQHPGQAAEMRGTEAELIRQLLPRAVASPAVASAFTTAQADQDRLRLFLDVSRIFLTMAQGFPTFFAVDDLHWADPSSLDLLRHLVFTLADTAERESVPLILVCTYRPREGGERLTRLLARIQRENICTTFTLRGLDEADVSALLQSLGLRPPSHQLTATVSQATQGNPLFIQEVFHHMVQQEALEERGGYVTTTAAPADLRLPEEVTSAIGAHIQRLSEDCRRVLTLAALLGDRVSLQILEAVSGMGAESLLDVLEEGIHQHLLLSEGQDVQFAHPLIQHVFYHTPSAARRQRLHQQIAQILEHLYADSRDAHLQEIAHHLIRAGPAAAPETIVMYARRAGDQAFTAAAWSDAAQYYEAALSAAESIAHFPIRDRAELHYRAGLARYWDMDAGPALDHYEKAIAAYRLAGDIRGVTRALMEQTRTRYTLSSVPLGTLVDMQPLEAALEALGERETELHGSILTVMSGAYSTARQQDKAKELAQRALEIGQRLQDDRLRAYAYFVLGVAQSRSLHVQEAVECFQKALVLARRCDDLVLQDWPLTRLPIVLMRLGRLQEAEAVSQEACALTRKYQDWAAYSVASSVLTSVAVAKGDFDAAESCAHETMLMVSRSHYPWGGVRALYALACTHTLRGDWAAAEAILDMLIEPGRVFREAGPMVQTTVHVLRQLVHTYAKIATEVPASRSMDVILSAEVDVFSLDPLCALVELADLWRVAVIAEHPYQVLQQAMNQGQLFSIGWVCLIPRVLGVAATLHHQWDVAEAHFQTALEVAVRLEARLEIGRTCLDYARMLAARDRRCDRPRLMALVDQARTLLTALGLHPLAQRATELTLALHSG